MLRLMRDCQPVAMWERGHHISFYAADQTYEWIGMKKRGARKTLERLDAAGMPVLIEHEVYVNSIKLHLPASLGNLSAADIVTIQNNHGSAYTEDFNNVFAPLDPVVVRGNLLAWVQEAMQLVAKRAQDEGSRVQDLTLRQIAHALFGRPNIDPGGASDFDILDPLARTDTKSYDDFVRITEHLRRFSDPRCIIEIFCGDGQSVISFKNLKRRWPSRYARWLIAVGGFHEHAHFLFGSTETFWLCFFCSCMRELGIERVRQVTHNLEHNAYAHHQTAHKVVTIAIICFLLQDVQYPPPSLLLRSIDAYALQVQSAGGIVMLDYLKGAGVPALHWLRAARRGDGLRLKELFAYSFHMFRATCHKPVCVQICLIALLGFCCALPALQAVLAATVSLSLLGRTGANMYVDRLVEAINNIQQGTKRSSNAASFGRAMDMTTLLRPLLHVRHAFADSEHNVADIDDALTTSELVQARVLQDWLLRMLGHDLTIHFPDNVFHHTGNAVPLHTGSAQERRPLEFIWQVAEALSRGKGRTSQASQERWDKHTRRFVFEHFFRY
jgi:hypothetical protein